jgi:hypothetical protein
VRKPHLCAARPMFDAFTRSGREKRSKGREGGRDEGREGVSSLSSLAFYHVLIARSLTPPSLIQTRRPPCCSWDSTPSANEPSSISPSPTLTHSNSLTHARTHAHMRPRTRAHADAKPFVLLVGQYSVGKTSFINHLLGAYAALCVYFFCVAVCVLFTRVSTCFLGVCTRAFCVCVHPRA